MQEGREVVSEIGWREALPAARDVVDAPPAMGSNGRGLDRLEAARVDLVRMDPDQEESFEVPLNLPPPGELDVASPHKGGTVATSTASPVSSRTSRTSASSYVSPGSSAPPGANHQGSLSGRSPRKSRRRCSASMMSARAAGRMAGLDRGLTVPA